MTKEECCRIFGIEDIMDLPQVAMDVIMGDKTRRDAIYAELLDVNRHDICMCTPDETQKRNVVNKVFRTLSR